MNFRRPNTIWQSDIDKSIKENDTVFLCSSKTDKEGKFLFWRWEIWAIGGSGGLQWYFRNKEIYPGRFNPLWLVFWWQHERKK